MGCFLEDGMVSSFLHSCQSQISLELPAHDSVIISNDSLSEVSHSLELSVVCVVGCGSV